MHVNAQHKAGVYMQPRYSLSTWFAFCCGGIPLLQADWAVNLGEHAVDLKVVTGPSGHAQLLVLGERSVFCFKDSGVLRFMKKLDFNPTCIHAYSIGQQPSTSTDSSASPGHGSEEVQYLVSSDSHQLLVFRDSTLIWAAALDHAPVDMATATFQ